MKTFSKIALVCLWVTSGTIAQGEVLYQLVNLGNFGSLSSSAIAINSAGVIVGNDQLSQFNHRAYVTENGVHTVIPLPAGSNKSDATDINDLGQVVGYAGGFTDTGSGAHAFLYSNGVVQDLGSFMGRSTYATSINNAGEICGYTQASDGSREGFLYKNGAYQLLGAKGIGNATSINESGQIAGLGGGSAVVLSGGVTTSLGAPAGFSIAYDINNSGQIVGDYRDSDDHAFFYSNGLFTPIPAGGISSHAFAINNWGQVVGEASNSGYLYWNGQVTNLNSLIVQNGWAINRAFDINDRRQIVAMGFHNSFGISPLLLNPVPEPSVGTILVIGAGMVLLGRGKKART